MSYTPTTWATGDVITAEKLNNMESGIEAGGLFVITATGINTTVGQFANITIDKTIAEISNAILSGMSPVVKFQVGESETNYSAVYARLISETVVKSDGMISTADFIGVSAVAGYLKTFLITIDESSSSSMCLKITTATS